MLITLAYPHDGHASDETIDVDPAVGRQMVRDGYARLPDPDVLDGLTVEQLTAYAADNGLDVGAARKKADVIDAIRAAEAARVPPSTPITPLPGTTEGDL